MSICKGPKIITNGLVLYLDATNPKSFRGEPTTNLVPYSDYSNRTYNSPYTASSWGGDAATITYYSSGGFNYLQYKKMIKTSGGSGGSYIDDNIGITIDDNKTYTISCWIKASRAVNVLGYANCINRASDNTYRVPSNLDLTTEWVRYSWTYASGTGHAGTYRSRHIIYIDDDLPLEVYWCGFQVEEKPYATNYVNGTRGTSVDTGGGLIDLSKNQNNGTIYNDIHFDSITRSLVFDGISSYIQLANDFTFDINYTISLWIDFTNVSDVRYFLGGDNSNGIRYNGTSFLIFNGSSGWEELNWTKINGFQNVVICRKNVTDFDFYMFSQRKHINL